MSARGERWLGVIYCRITYSSRTDEYEVRSRLGVHVSGTYDECEAWVDWHCWQLAAEPRHAG